MTTFTDDLFKLYNSYFLFLLFSPEYFVEYTGAIPVSVRCHMTWHGAWVDKKKV